MTPPAPLADLDGLLDLSVEFAAPSASSLTDADLLERQRVLGEVRRRVDAAAARVAAEIAERSRPELGHDGLAQRLGVRTAVKLVQRASGATASHSATLVQVGGVLTRDDEPWLAPASAAAVAGVLSLDALAAVRTGLGAPGPSISAAALGDAVSLLLAEAPSLTVEQLAVRARDVRAALDDDGVADREQLLRDQRYLTISRRADGMTSLRGLLDPESAEVVVDAFDAVTSPRRGGPRFVDPAAVARDDALLRDARTTEQLALDGFVELVRVGAAADGGRVLGTRHPAVRVLVTAADLDRRAGSGRIEGQTEPIGIATVERYVCAAGAVPLRFDASGQVLDVGRDQRLFTTRQRLALAVRDGGCRFPGCERPPSWTEAHHLTEWSRGGRTDLADGVLLCRHHHLLVHNNGWRVSRADGTYSVVPPPDLDREQRPIPAPSKSPLVERLRHAPAG